MSSPVRTPVADVDLAVADVDLAVEVMDAFVRLHVDAADGLRLRFVGRSPPAPPDAVEACLDQRADLILDPLGRLTSRRRGAGAGPTS